MKTISELIALWGSYGALGDDIKQSAGAVRKWKERNKIPAEHLLAILIAAEKRHKAGEKKFSKVTPLALLKICAAK